MVKGIAKFVGKAGMIMLGIELFWVTIGVWLTAKVLGYEIIPQWLFASMGLPMVMMGLIMMYEARAGRELMRW